MAAACFHETVIPTTQMRWHHNQEVSNLGYFRYKRETREYIEYNNLTNFMHNKEMDIYLEYDIQNISCIAHKDMLAK
jgi:hypothetical protein